MNHFPLYGSGNNVRDWLHVYDHCTAIDLIIHKGRDGEVYNIGGHKRKNKSRSGKGNIKGIRQTESLISFVLDRAGHDLRYATNPDKIMKELGWKPKYTFETGIGPTIQWNLENQEWFEELNQ